MIASFRIGTRPSRLATTQARGVRDALRGRWPFVTFDVVPMATEGDDRRGALREESAEFKRAFTGRIEEALLGGQVAAAVHSLKDLPARPSPGVRLGAVPPREVPNDAFVSRSGLRLNEVPRGARVGTSSHRRRVQLLAAYPGLEVRPIEGNVDTRLRKLDAGEFDGLVLAAAGLRRLGLESRITELLPFDTMVPAVGQGALAVQVREGDAYARGLVAAADDPASRGAIEAELELAAALGLDCNVPAGAHAWFSDGTLHLKAMVASLDGRELARVHAAGPASDREAVVASAARQLRDAGAESLLKRGSPAG